MDANGPLHVAVPTVTVPDKQPGGFVIPKPAKTTNPEVTFACGHKGHPPKKCGACRNEANRVNAAKSKEQRDKSRKAGRLPDGAEFHVAYDATMQLWSGHLTFEEAGACHSFDGQASGVFHLLAKLDRQYRQAKASETVADTKAPFVSDQATKSD